MPKQQQQLQAKEYGTVKIKSASNLFGALAVSDKHRAEFVNILQGLTIKQDGLALLTSDEC